MTKVLGFGAFCNLTRFPVSRPRCNTHLVALSRIKDSMTSSSWILKRAVCTPIITDPKSKLQSFQTRPLSGIEPETSVYTVNNLLDLLLQLLDKEVVQQDKAFYQLLDQKCMSLVSLNLNDPLSPSDRAFYVWAVKLFDVAGKVRTYVHQKLLQSTSPSKQETPAFDKSDPILIRRISREQESLEMAPRSLQTQTGSTSPFYSMMIDKELPPEELKKIPRKEFLSAIEKEPHHSTLYLNLGRLLSNTDLIKLRNGSKLTQQQLYLKAIDLDKNNPHAYYYLGATLPEGKSIQLLDGTTMTQQQLYLKVIALGKDSPHGYIMLGTTLSEGESIQLLDGTTMTKQQLFLKTIDLDQNFSFAYCCLGITLPIGGSIQLLDGNIMTQQQLYLKAIDLNKNDPDAYNNLGAPLPTGGSIQLLDGTTMTKQQLFLRAIELNRNYSHAYNNLGATLLKGESIQLLDGTTMTKQQLFLKAIELDPVDNTAYLNLGKILSDDESIKLPNGTVMTRQQLLLM